MGPMFLAPDTFITITLQEKTLDDQNVQLLIAPRPRRLVQRVSADSTRLPSSKSVHIASGNLFDTAVETFAACSKLSNGQRTKEMPCTMCRDGVSIGGPRVVETSVTRTLVRLRPWPERSARRFHRFAESVSALVLDP